MATVLIVEDQEQILTLAQSFLEEQGHKTLSAATADEALAILTGSEAVDALFVDIILKLAAVEFHSLRLIVFSHFPKDGGHVFVRCTPRMTGTNLRKLS